VIKKAWRWIRQRLEGQLARHRERAWHRRPRFHPARLNDLRRTAQLVQIFGSDARLTLFKERVSAYQEKPSLENYLRLRRDIPDAEIDVALFGGLDPLFALAEELVKHGIDPILVAGALDASEPAIDELSLRLMECLVARGKLSDTGPGHIEQRRNAISDTLINYLIVIMLEAMEWNESNPIVVPSSLIVLIRDRLCGEFPDLRKTYLSREARDRAALLVANRFRPDETLSVRKLAALAGTSRGTAARWLADPEFQHHVTLCRKILAGEGL